MFLHQRADIPLNSHAINVQEELGEIARHDVAIETTFTLERQQEKKAQNILMEEVERRPANILEEQKEGREMDILEKQERQGRRESGVCLEFEEFEPDDYNERRQIAQTKDWKEGKKERGGRREERRQTQQVQIEQIQKKLQGEENVEKEVIYSKPRKEERAKAEQSAVLREDVINKREINPQQQQKKEEKRQKSPSSKKEDKHSKKETKVQSMSTKKDEKKKTKKEEKPSRGDGLVELIGVKGLVGRAWPPPPAQPSDEDEEKVEKWTPNPIGKLQPWEDKSIQKPAKLQNREQPEVVNRKELVSKTPHYTYQNGMSPSNEAEEEAEIVAPKISQNSSGSKSGKDRDR